MTHVLRQWALAVARPVHVRLRSQKVDLFCRHVSGTGLTLLDVGGGTGIAGEFLRLYSHFSSVVMANLDPSLEGLNGCRILPVAADGRQLPFTEKSFDWVFSNAVIEHVGDYEKQRVFANEIRRVAAKGYFVTTPNKYFPIEPHSLLPFYQFLSPAWQRRVVQFSPGYMREYEEINLLSAGQMQRLFPEAKVISTGVPLFRNSLVACYKSP
ncbi:MAG: methyltransferase domain-containing protein [Candidatus Acidiferrales bacterium]